MTIKYVEGYMRTGVDLGDEYEYKENRIRGDFHTHNGGVIHLSVRSIEDITGPICKGDKICVVDCDGNRCTGKVLGTTAVDDSDGYSVPMGIKIQLDFSTKEYTT